MNCKGALNFSMNQTNNILTVHYNKFYLQSHTTGFDSNGNFSISLKIIKKSGLERSGDSSPKHGKMTPI